MAIHIWYSTLFSVLAFSAEPAQSRTFVSCPALTEYNVDAKNFLNDHEGYTLLFDYAPDGVIMIDQYNVIKFWNKKAEEIFGWPSGAVLGKESSGVIVPERFREAHKNGMNRYMTTGEVRVLNKTIEVPALHQSGHEFFIALTISKIELSGVTNFLAFIRDITAQKNEAAKLEEKTRQLERANEQLEQFASIASHDLKEPLRKMQMYSSQITDSNEGDLPPATIKNLQKINDAAKRMQELIDGILSYSSLNMEGGEKPFSLQKALNEAVNSLEQKIRETNARIVSQDLPVAVVNPFQMQQLFQNLIANALKFSKAGLSPVINISYAVVDGVAVQQQGLQPADQYLQIQVTDNGIGFDNKVSEKIFGLFQRLHSKSTYEGSGLGLAICKRVVENHGGSISANSSPGKGTTFTVTLPHYVKKG